MNPFTAVPSLALRRRGPVLHSAVKPSPAAHPTTAAVMAQIERDVLQVATRRWSASDSLLLGTVLCTAARHLTVIADHLDHGRVRPDRPLRVSPHQLPVPGDGRPTAIGVFPVYGNPLHWGHLLTALAAMAVLALDRVVFLVQGTDRRKSLSRLTEPHRHEMAKDVLELLWPLGVYSNLGRGSDVRGERSVFRLLKLQPRCPLRVFYLVGANHHRTVDERGRPDTVALLEQNLRDPSLGFDPALHQLEIAFVDRGRSHTRPPVIESSLPTMFLGTVLEASSAQVRAGALALSPYRVLRYLDDHPDYAEVIGFRDRRLHAVPNAGPA